MCISTEDFKRLEERIDDKHYESHTALSGMITKLVNDLQKRMQHLEKDAEANGVVLGEIRDGIHEVVVQMKKNV